MNIDSKTIGEFKMSDKVVKPTELQIGNIALKHFKFLKYIENPITLSEYYIDENGNRVEIDFQKQANTIYFYNYPSITVPTNMLKFTATKPSTIKLQKVNGTYKYSVNRQDWNDYTLGNTIDLNEGDTLYFSAISSNTSCSKDGVDKAFVMTGEIYATGNIQYMLDSTGTQLTVPMNGYKYLFNDCSALIHAPDLSATNIANWCYYGMFKNCVSLSVAPELPAQTLKENCYTSMFNGCTALSDAPFLPATQLKTDCYSQMFDGCSNLSSLNVNFSTWETSERIELDGTINWVRNVLSSGHFYCPENLIEKRGDNYIPNDWSIN